MAKPIIVTLNGVESSFEHAKLERSRLYGARRRLPLDQTGQPWLAKPCRIHELRDAIASVAMSA